MNTRQSPFLYKSILLRLFVAVGLLFLMSSCNKDEETKTVTPPPVDTTDNTPDSGPFDINAIKDTYEDVAATSSYMKWGPYNVHDPALIKEGDYFYCYSTDAAYGTEIRSGIQIRKSKDLVKWEFVGWAFSSLPAMGLGYIKNNGGTAFNSLWAPYVVKAGNEFRLYYSISSAVLRLSAIGLATSSSPTGPWVETGLVVTSKNDNSVATNAIDPSVIIDPQGQHWMYYGSAWDGIYILKLDPTTGLPTSGAGIGKRIAHRGWTGNNVNGNIEGPEIIYNKSNNKYYLFIAYDWLETKYNVRVGRADTPEGPFLDYLGRDVNIKEDHLPMILAPYQFKDHGGWQGVSHPGVIEDKGKYYIAHQGRPGVNKFFMVLHIRQIYWTEDGWPVVSPERYAGVEAKAVTKEEIAGSWERIVLNYTVVPGYSNEQISPDFQAAVPITLDASGTIDGNNGNSWKYEAPWLILSRNNGVTEKVFVDRERDWERKIESTLIFTGLNEQGTAVWGKKVN